MSKKHKIKGLDKRLAEIISESPLTQLEIANKMGIDQAQISRWKKGETEPTAYMLTQFIKSSKTQSNLSWLLTGKETERETIIKAEENSQMEEEMFKELVATQRQLIEALQEISDLKDMLAKKPQPQSKKVQNGG
jgi:transcriptional regulator with XRE-family HTH domain